MQAQVLWPVDMPDDMLEDAIQISKKAMDEHDFEEHGVDVSAIITLLLRHIFQNKFQIILGPLF